MMLAANPFISAYLQSDWFGKGIFWALFLLSLLSWSLLAFKIWQMTQVRKLSSSFKAQFSQAKEAPLEFQFTRSLQTFWSEIPHPFFEIYKTAKQHTLQLLSRNHSNDPQKIVALSTADLELIESQTGTEAASQCKSLERHLFILSTITTLGPFLGLLGTVWGILLTFNQLPQGLGASNTAMLSGLSMALATTIIGLVVAIPALVGYNYLKNASREYKRELEHFSFLLIGAIELQYRRDS